MDRLDRALRLTERAIDAFVRVDDEEVRAFVEAVDRTDFDAIGVFAEDTLVGDDKGHGVLLGRGSLSGRALTGPTHLRATRRSGQGPF